MADVYKSSKSINVPKGSSQKNNYSANKAGGSKMPTSHKIIKK